MTNCETFHDLLHELLDETLDAGSLAFAQQHLEQCGSCQRAFLREQAFARAMRASLERATAGISVHPQMRQNVIRALAPTPARANPWRHGWQSLVPFLIRPTAAAAALFGVILLLLGVRFYRQEARESSSKTIAPGGLYACVITVPLQTQTHVFRRRNNTIEDAVVFGAGIGSASLLDGSKQTSPKPSSNP